MTSPTTLQNVLNFRDVGKTINEYLGQRRVREGVFYRSARPDDATLGDRNFIRDELGVRAIIDLRTKTEHVNQIQRRNMQRATPALVESNAALAGPLRIEGLDYHEIKLTGRQFERFLVSQLTWRQYLRLISLYVFGYRTEAIRIIGKEVMQPRGLVGLGLDTLDHSGAEINETLSQYTSTASIPSIIHCTQGKDRTGLICALLLMILGVPQSAITYDYSLTDDALIPEREDRIAEVRSIGLTDDWARTANDMIVRIERHLNDKYGGLEAYLDGIGFSHKDRAGVREVLLY